VLDAKELFMRELVYHLEGVSYSYLKLVPVLVGINLSVFAGEKLVILGANGCGKSTLLKLLDGLIFPNQGRIQAFGEELNERLLSIRPYPFRKKVGLVFQDSDSQLFCSNVFDEVAFAPLQLDWDPKWVQEQVTATLRDFELQKLAERPPFRLSGGEKKKVALAAVTVHNPQVLLLDEPTSGLDPRTKRWFLSRLEEFNRTGTTVIMATHDLEIARTMADRVIVMNEQHGIEMIANPEEVFKDQQLLTAVNLI
jgi:cobalt/nickel transport system ATP-binding protein